MKNKYPLPTRTVLYSHKKHIQPVPEVGKKYYCFDDGKIRFSRLYIVEIKEVLGQMQFKKKYPEQFKQWLEISKSHYWLYSRSSDKFIVANCNESEEHSLGVFVRTKQGGWFGIGNLFNCGELDIDRSNYNWLINHLNELLYSEEEKERLIKENTI